MTTRSELVPFKQRTVADWERIIRRGSPTRCRELIIKAIKQFMAMEIPLTTPQHNLLEAALNTGDL